MPCILALDEGTTSARAIVFEQSGRVRAVAQREFEQSFPKPGWVEHDPAEIWAVQASVATEALERARVTARDIAAVGVTNQRETALLWDRATGEPLAPAIVWQDRRTAGRCEALRSAGHEAEVRARTGLVIDPYFSATKIGWLLAHVKGARDAAGAGRLAFGTIDSWLLWKLTGGRVHATDVSNASRTLLFNIHTMTWDDELLSIFGVPREILPEVVASAGAVAEVSALPGLAGVPIAGIAGDQQAALFGQGCLAPGEVKNTYGTGCFMLQNTGTSPVESAHRLMTTVAWQIAGETTYALEGGVFVAGAAIQWLRDGLGLIRRAEEINTLAAGVPDSGGVAFVPALSGLGSPRWDPHARGMLIGMSRSTTAAHIARATLEGIVHQVADLLEAMEADTGRSCETLRVDGGAARSDLLMQIQADVLGVPVVRPASAEITALGAARLAGLASGAEIGSDAEAGERRFEPGGGTGAISRERWREALSRAGAWATEEDL